MIDERLVDFALCLRDVFVDQLMLVAIACHPERVFAFESRIGANASKSLKRLSKMGVAARFSRPSRADTRIRIMMPTPQGLASVVDLVRAVRATSPRFDLAGPDPMDSALDGAHFIRGLYAQGRADEAIARWPGVSYSFEHLARVVCQSSSQETRLASVPCFLQSRHAFSVEASRDRAFRALYLAVMLGVGISREEKCLRARILIEAGLLSRHDMDPVWRQMLRIDRVDQCRIDADLVDFDAFLRFADPVLEAFAAHDQLEDVRAALIPERSIFDSDDRDPRHYYIHRMIAQDIRAIRNADIQI